MTGPPKKRQNKDTASVPAPVPHFLAPRIYALAMILRRATNLVARRELDLSQEKARVLILLGDLQPLQLGDLASRTTLDRGQLSRGVSELVEQGLVLRKRQGRSIALSLSKDGETIFAALKLNAEQRNEELMQDFTAEEQQWMYEALDKIIDRAQAMFEHERQFQLER